MMVGVGALLAGLVSVAWSDGPAYISGGDMYAEIDPGSQLPSWFCEDNGDCDARHFCSKRVGDCDGIGRCRVRPNTCPEYYDPVCGCDGVTYSNQCFAAAAAGMSIDHWGPCE